MVCEHSARQQVGYRRRAWPPVGRLPIRVATRSQAPFRGSQAARGSCPQPRLPQAWATAYRGSCPLLGHLQAKWSRARSDNRPQASIVADDMQHYRFRRSNDGGHENRAVWQLGFHSTKGQSYISEFKKFRGLSFYPKF
ncbi:hypothetical protein B296_00051007 [Ensete ventricosum]|uniref:Uncharacterized protein n=1 Tax=Ensete ventricosum TaxID=4639 RepID=A0A426YIM8_ENSVE|nr:hypothetical protein B296_00051007 [Ensete ventricosum]